MSNGTDFRRPSKTTNTTVKFLRRKGFNPMFYVIPGLIPEGLTILAGKPKIGKSWMALDIASGLAGGYYILGNIKLEQADVLYCALEDNERRLQNRLLKILEDKIEW